MASKWLLPRVELTEGGRPVLQPGEVECFSFSSVDLECENNPTLSTLSSGLLILTTHRLLWIPNAAAATISTSPLYASGIPLKSVSRIFSIKKSIESIFANPKVRFQVSISSDEPGSSSVVITFVLSGEYDPDAFLVKFWEAWRRRAWEKSSKEGPSGSNSDEEIEKNSRNLCIKCNKSGPLLVCSEVRCPLAFHKECMPQTLSIDNMDNFYCLYCSYKRTCLETSKKWKSVLLAKKNLSFFLGNSYPNTETNAQMQKAPEGGASILGETACDEITKHLNADGVIVHSDQLENDQEVEKGTQIDENPEAREQCDAKSDDDEGHQVERAIQVDKQQEAEEPNIPTTELEISADSSRKRKCDNKRPELQEHDLEPSSRLRKSKLSSSDERKMKEKNRIAGTFKEKQKRKAGVEKRRVEHKEKTPATSVKTRTRTVEHKKEVEETLEPSVRKRLIIREPSLVVEHKEITTTTTSDDSLTESSNESKPHQFPQKKRKKCPWRVEEEEMLKEGVEKFSTEIKKNISWKKVLEFGAHVFDKTRNSRDLKDKWKNLQAKEQPPPGQ